MVKVTVPGTGGFTALLFGGAALARDGEAYYLVPRPPKGLNPIAVLRASRSAGAWQQITEEIYQQEVDRLSRVA